ncbi:MAG: baeRF11 domain-containing protein [Solirubrobacterales bacterium]
MGRSPNVVGMGLHTDIPSRRQIERLLQARGDDLVSIYLPTTPITPEADAARIAFKNLAAEAVAELDAGAADRKEIEGALEDLHDDRDFWAEQAHSLAVFADPRGLRAFRLPNRLTEAVQVADRYYVKPLLRTVTFPQTAFVLALAEGSVRLLEVTPDLPTFEVRVPDLPSDAADAVGKASITDRSPARRLQGTEGRKTLVRSYARAVDRALRGVLGGQDVPLILAASEPIDAIFRSVNSYPHLADRSLPGSPEDATDAELGEAAREVLDGLYADQLRELTDRFEERSAAGRTAVEINDLGRAATFGAVETLFVDIDAKLAGTIDEESGAVSLDDAERAGDYGVADELCRRVILAGGTVLAVRAAEVPGGGPAAAILRYPV